MKDISGSAAELPVKPLRRALRDPERCARALDIVAELGTPGLAKDVAKHLKADHVALAVTALFAIGDSSSVTELYRLWEDKNTAKTVFDHVQKGFTSKTLTWTEIGMKYPNKWAKLIGKEKRLSLKAYDIVTFQFGLVNVTAQKLRKTWTTIKKQYEVCATVFEFEGEDLLRRVSVATDTTSQLGHNLCIRKDHEIVFDGMCALDKLSFQIRIRVLMVSNRGQLCVNLESERYEATEVAWTDTEWTFGLTGPSARERTDAYNTHKVKSGKWVTLTLKLKHHATKRTYEASVDDTWLSDNTITTCTGTLEKLSLRAVRGEFMVGGFELVPKPSE